jgi:hypothetical protein
VEAPLDPGLASEAEAFELAPLDFLGHCVVRHEGDAEPFASRPLDRLGGVEFRDPLRLDAGGAKRAVGDLLCARARLAYEQRLRAEHVRLHLALRLSQQSRLGNADDLVGEERLELDPLVRGRIADEGQVDPAGQQSFDDLPCGCDLDFDRDVRMVALEASEGGRRPAQRGRSVGPATARSRTVPPARAPPAPSGKGRSDLAVRAALRPLRRCARSGGPSGYLRRAATSTGRSLWSEGRSHRP